MGRGSSNGRPGAGGGGGGSRTPSWTAVDKTGFTNNGNGTWSFDIPGVGGAQIVEETGGSRALNMGYMPTQRLYSMTWWDKNYTEHGVRQYYDRLNDAKYYAKEAVKAEARRG